MTWSNVTCIKWPLGLFCTEGGMESTVVELV